jgi:cation diffusion facilitator family transporter
MTTRRTSLTTYAWLSVGAAVITVALKLLAYALTGSVALLSDALESLVNVMAGGVAVAMLKLAERPPDEEHPYGHHKAEYFSSGLEGLLILVAALGIGWTAFRRLLAPVPLEQPAAGLVIVAIATVLNLVVARVLFRAGRRGDSITLEANAQHLMTDVWTSSGVIVGVALAALTGWHRLDALIAIAVALHIVSTGFMLMRRSALGMLDTAIGSAEQASVAAVLQRHEAGGHRVPRRAHPPGRRAPLRLHARPRARRLDGQPRPRTARADRGRGPRRRARLHRVHPPRGPPSRDVDRAPPVSARTRTSASSAAADRGGASDGR